MYEILKAPRGGYNDVDSLFQGTCLLRLGDPPVRSEGGHVTGLSCLQQYNADLLGQLPRRR